MFFKETFDLIVEGKKTCTTRVPAFRWYRWYKRKIGRILLAEDGKGNKTAIKLTNVLKTTLGYVASNFYSEEGFDSEEEFKEVWLKLHYKHWRPRNSVCVLFFEKVPMSQYKKRKRRKSVKIPKSDTKPERLMKNKVVNPTLEKLGFMKNRFNTNDPFHSKFLTFPIFPDGDLLDLPLVWEVDGVKWHRDKGKKKLAKDEAKNNCYLAGGKYVYRVTDEALLKDIEKVKYDFEQFLKVIIDEHGDVPKLRKYPRP